MEHFSNDPLTAKKKFALMDVVFSRSRNYVGSIYRNIIGPCPEKINTLYFFAIAMMVYFIFKKTASFQEFQGGRLPTPVSEVITEVVSAQSVFFNMDLRNIQ